MSVPESTVEERASALAENLGVPPELIIDRFRRERRLAFEAARRAISDRLRQHESLIDYDAENPCNDPAYRAEMGAIARELRHCCDALTNLRDSGG